jgi:EAL and modified HD-GYP domain-containing signal transduction protein
MQKDMAPLGRGTAMDQQSTDLVVRHLVARQPIFDRGQKVIGYELLFRSGWTNHYDYHDPVMATTQVINNTVNVVGLVRLLTGRKAFVNFTRDSLLAGDYQLLPAAASVIELPCDVVVDQRLVEACRVMKSEGYGLALNDMVDPAAHGALIDLADVIKIDFTIASDKLRRALVKRFAGHGVRLLAAKVETGVTYQTAIDLGYDYVQGFFFCEPQIVSARDMPAFKRNHIAFLREVNQLEPDFDQLERIVKQEPSLSYKLLRYLNTAAIGLGAKVESIRQAIVLLGERPLRKWAALVALTCLAKDKPAQLMVTTLTRARFCELIAPHADMADREFDLYMVGLLSTLDVVTDRPMDELLMELPLSIDVKASLLGGGSRLARVLALILALERGEVEETNLIRESFDLDSDVVEACYQQALGWVDDIFA